MIRAVTVADRFVCPEGHETRNANGVCGACYDTWIRKQFPTSAVGQVREPIPDGVYVVPMALPEVETLRGIHRARALPGNCPAGLVVGAQAFACTRDAGHGGDHEACHSEDHSRIVVAWSEWREGVN